MAHPRPADALPAGPDPGLFERICSALPVGALLVRDERIVYANPALLQLLGVTPEEMVGELFHPFVSEEHRELVISRHRARQKHQAAPPRYEVMLIGSGGRKVPAELEARTLPSRETLCLIREVTSRVREVGHARKLVEIVGRLQRARTEEAVWSTAEAELLALGVRLVVLRLSNGRIEISRWHAPVQVMEAIRELTGRPLVGSFREPSEFPWLEPLLASNEVVFEEDVITRLGHQLGGSEEVRAALEVALAGTGHGKAVVAPLHRDGMPHAVVALCSDTLTSTEAASLALFVPQLSAALDVAHSIEDLHSSNLQLRTIRELATAGVDTALEQLLPQLAKMAGDAIAADSVAVRILDPEREALVLAAVVGRREPVEPRSEVLRFEDIGWRHGARSLIFDTDKISPVIRGAYDREGLLHHALVPMATGNRVVGAIAFGRRTVHPFTEDELRFAEAMAQQIAIHVERHQRSQLENRRVQLMELLFGLTRVGTEALEVAPLADRALTQIVAALRVDTATLHVTRGRALALVGRQHSNPDAAHVPMPELQELPIDEGSLNGRAALRRAVQVVTPGDETPSRTQAVFQRRGARHAAAVPLTIQDRLVGTLMVGRKTDRRFLDEELKLLESVAGHLAVAIEQARLFEEERRHVRDLQVMLDLSRVVTASLDLPRILDAAAHSLPRVVDGSHAFIWLLDEDGKNLRGVATSAEHHRDHFLQVRLTEDQASLAWAAVRSRQPVRADDAPTASAVQQELARIYHPRGMVALPLLVHDQPIGSVVITDEERPRTWAESELGQATLLARQVAVGVANAKSYAELARAQEELVKREKLAALGELSAVMAHEVRNPLAVIFNSVVALRKELKPEGNAALLLDILREEGERLNRIVGELLDFARPLHAEVRPEPLEAVISGAMEAARNSVRSPKVKVKLEVEKGLTAAVDAQLMRQALVNLFTNALQAMSGAGGMLQVRAGRVEGAERVTIDVADNGPGIAPELLDRVFQPFFSTKATGTGLGLAVVKRIAEAHRGEVKVSSGPGEGTCFTLTLPIEG